MGCSTLSSACVRSGWHPRISHFQACWSGRGCFAGGRLVLKRRRARIVCYWCIVAVPNERKPANERRRATLPLHRSNRLGVYRSTVTNAQRSMASGWWGSFRSGTLQRLVGRGDFRSSTAARRSYVRSPAARVEGSRAARRPHGRQSRGRPWRASGDGHLAVGRRALSSGRKGGNLYGAWLRLGGHLWGGGQL